MAQGTSGKPKLSFKFSRPMLIVIGILLILVVVVVIAALVLQRSAGPQAQVQAPKGTALPKVTTVPSPAVGAGTPKGVTPVQPTSPPPPVTQPPAPPPTQEVVIAVATAGPTMRPAPTQAGGGPSTTPGVGGPEKVPAAASGVPWLIPIGVLLLAAVLWWRWRRAHSTN